MENYPDDHQHNIVILGMDSDGKLKLSDGGTTNAHPGDKVTWEIDPDSGVAAIFIMDDNGSPNVFQAPPRKVRHGTDWQGTVKHDIKNGAVEDYSIFFYLDRGDGIGRYDPKIQVNP